MREGFEPPVRFHESLIFKTSPVPLWHRTIYNKKKSLSATIDSFLEPTTKYANSVTIRDNEFIYQVKEKSSF